MLALRCSSPALFQHINIAASTVRASSSASLSICRRQHSSTGYSRTCLLGQRSVRYSRSEPTDADKTTAPSWRRFKGSKAASQGKGIAKSQDKAVNAGRAHPIPPPPKPFVSRSIPYPPESDSSKPAKTKDVPSEAVLSKDAPPKTQIAAHKAAPPKAARSRRGRGRVFLASFGVVAIITSAAVYFTDLGKYGFDTAIRSTRVIKTTYVCIKDYQNTIAKGEQQSAEEYQAALKACHKRCAERTLRAMEKNGSIFIKLGQHLSSLNYLLPSEWCDTFIPLQDKCPITSFEQVKRLVEGDTGRRFEDVFEEFEELPLGAASLAQVHRAIDKATGERVAVKVQHPTLDHFAPVDVALTSWTFRMLRRAFPEYDLTWLSDEMEVSLPQELDFAQEGANAERARAYFTSLNQADIPLVIPKVMWAQRRILVMEYITGARPDDLQYLDSHGISRDEVSAALARIFNTMIFAPGAPLHCDPHGGNIAIRYEAPAGRAATGKDSVPLHLQRGRFNFSVILYDHGLYRTIPLELQRSYAKLWLAVLDADEGRMRQYAKEVGGISDADFPLFASAITGREYAAVTANITVTPRTQEEWEHITTSLYSRSGGGSTALPGAEGSEHGPEGAAAGGSGSGSDPSAPTDPSTNTGTQGSGGMLQQLVGLLGKIPRIILLILKTNDLTRSLDTNLHTTQGPLRAFLILARYAARTVYDEQLEQLAQLESQPGPGTGPESAHSHSRSAAASLRLRIQLSWWRLAAWSGYMRREFKLHLYESWLWLRGIVGLDNSITMPTLDG